MKSTKFLSSSVCTSGNLLSYCSGFRHLKDVILLTAIVQVLSTISSYFWYLWLLVRVFVDIVLCPVFLINPIR